MNFKFSFKFQLNMKKKLTFEIRIFHKNRLALMAIYTPEQVHFLVKLWFIYSWFNEIKLAQAFFVPVETGREFPQQDNSKGILLFCQYYGLLKNFGLKGDG